MPNLTYLRLTLKLDLQVVLELQGSVNFLPLKFMKNCGWYGQRSTFRNKGRNCCINRFVFLLTDVNIGKITGPRIHFFGISNNKKYKFLWLKVHHLKKIAKL